MSQVEALRATVAVLDLPAEYGALVAYCEGLAEQIDLKPFAASLWREYRPALELLFVAGVGEADDGQAALLELVRTPVRDAEASGT